MKKITLLFILFSSVAFAQINLTGTAKYEMSITGYVGSSGSGCGESKTGGLQWVVGTDINNTVSTLVQAGTTPYPGTGRGVRGSAFNSPQSIYYTETNKINRITLRTSRRSTTDIGGACKSTQDTDGSFYIGTCLSINVSFESLGLNQPGNIVTTVKPVINLVNPEPSNDIIGSDSYLNIPPIVGILNQYYTWQYSTNNGVSWTDLPVSYQQKNFLNILGSDFPNVAFGSPLAIRVKTGCNGAMSNLLNFTYQKSAPKILSVSTNETTCYMGDDGVAVIKFNRQLLLPNEAMNLNLKREFSTGGFQLAIPTMMNPLIDSNNELIIPNLKPGKYQITTNGFFNGNPVYSPYTEELTPFEFTIGEPDYLDFTISREDIWCKDGANGKIFINATGGSGSYFFSIDEGVNWTPFNNTNNHTIVDLAPNNYKVIVKDSKDCISRLEISTTNGITLLGGTKENIETIVEPTAALSVSYFAVEPTFYGATNGRIVTNVTGGTRFVDNSYEFEWKNSSNIVQTATGSFNGSEYVIILDNIPSGIYTLTVKDKNYNLSLPVSTVVTPYNSGCTVSNSEYNLSQPAPIVVIFEETKPISCNITNQFFDATDLDGNGERDEAQDGILVAHVTGGVKITNFTPQSQGKPYIYNWKRQDASGNWVNLNIQDSIIQRLSHAKYALNIVDKNQIVLGTYDVNNSNPVAKDSTYFMIQPEKLNLNFSSNAPTCNPGSNGLIKANVSGGTPPYTFSWSNDETTQTINNLNPNSYSLLVEDARGCRIMGSITIASPNGLTITESVNNPTCFNGNDGSITIVPTGGFPFLTGATYTYLWNTGATTQNISNLVEGDYWVTITDRVGCSLTKEFSLVHPPLTLIELGADTTLCNGQSLELNIAIPDAGATYSWSSTNGFSSAAANVSLTNAGTYSAIITNGQGCQVQDQVIVTTKNLAISSEFLVTSQAYVNEEIVIVNTSNPFGQNTEWIIPATATITEQSNNKIVIKFGTVGIQTISLKQTQEDCIAYFHKNINIEERSTLPDPGVTDNPFVTEFNVFPNPNDGNFEVVVKIQEISPIKLRLFPYNGQAVLHQKSESGSKEYNVNFNVIIPSGTYILVLETAKTTMVKKVIIL